MSPRRKAGAHTPCRSLWAVTLIVFPSDKHRGLWVPARGRDDAVERVAPYAARIFAMKRSSSSRNRVLSLERVLAEFNTSSDADPVSVAPRLTCMILAAASWVPCATF